ncbi:hypothetical protein ACF0H5_002805 [Mactra antiquata]
MSSIPVRRGGAVTRRSGVSRENSNETNCESKVVNRNTGKENKHKPFVRQGSKKELEEENARLNNLIQDYEQKLDGLKSKLNITEEELVKATNETHTVKDDLEKRILSYNIDPVTKTKISLSTDEEKDIENCREKSKEQVKVLKEKLQQINSVSVAYISQLEEFSFQLEEVTNGEAQTICEQNTNDAATLT